MPSFGTRGHPSKRAVRRDSDDEDSQMAKGDIEKECGEIDMVAITMHDLGSQTRHKITSRDTGPKSTTVPLYRLNAMKRANQQGTDEQKQFEASRMEITSWNNFVNTVQPEGEVLPDINSGNSHRFKLSKMADEERKRAGGEIDWDALDDEPRRPVNRGYKAVGRGGGVAGGRGRLSPLKSDRPLDPAVDPNRIYTYKTKKKGKSAMEAYGGTEKAHGIGGNNVPRRPLGYGDVNDDAAGSKILTKASKPRTPRQRHELPAWFKLVENPTAESVMSTTLQNDVVPGQLQNSAKSPIGDQKPSSSSISSTSHAAFCVPLQKVEVLKNLAISPKAMAPVPKPSSENPKEGVVLSASGGNAAQISPLGVHVASFVNAIAQRPTFNPRAYGQPPVQSSVISPSLVDEASKVRPDESKQNKTRQIPVSELGLLPQISARSRLGEASSWTDGKPSPGSLGSGFTSTPDVCSSEDRPMPQEEVVEKLSSQFQGLGISLTDPGSVIVDDKLSRGNDPGASADDLVDLMNEDNAQLDQAVLTPSTSKPPTFINVDGVKYVLADCVPKEHLPDQKPTQLSKENHRTPVIRDFQARLGNGYSIGPSRPTIEHNIFGNHNLPGREKPASNIGSLGQQVILPSVEQNAPDKGSHQSSIACSLYQPHEIAREVSTHVQPCSKPRNPFAPRASNSSVADNQPELAVQNLTGSRWGDPTASVVTRREFVVDSTLPLSKSMTPSGYLDQPRTSTLSKDERLVVAMNSKLGLDPRVNVQDTALIAPSVVSGVGGGLGFIGKEEIPRVKGPPAGKPYASDSILSDSRHSANKKIEKFYKSSTAPFGRAPATWRGKGGPIAHMRVTPRAGYEELLKTLNEVGIQGSTGGSQVTSETTKVTATPQTAPAQPTVTEKLANRLGITGIDVDSDESEL